MLGKKAVFNIPQLLRKVDIVFVRVFKTLYLVPYRVKLLLAILLYLRQRGSVVYTFAAAENRHLKFNRGKTCYGFALPCMIRVKYFVFLRAVDNLVRKRNYIRNSLACIVGKKPVNLFETGVCDF